jgi:hypothetical protein
MLPGINGRVIAVTAAVLLSFGAGRQAPVKVTRSTRHHSPIKKHEYKADGTTSSTNWSGYAIPSAPGSVTYVSGSWKVPTATCGTAENDTTGYAAFWVGIDGYSSNTVEQTGTDSDCVSTNGRKTDTPTYYAWFEFYPGGSYLIEFSNGIKPGDTMNATVTYNGLVSTGRRNRIGPGSSATEPEFTITIEDVTTGQSYSTSALVDGAQESSAEWIAEAPCCENNGDILPLADFNPWAGFTATSATISGSASSASASSAEEIAMMGEISRSTIKAEPSAANSGAFTVTWLNAGP